MSFIHSLFTSLLVELRHTKIKLVPLTHKKDYMQSEHQGCALKCGENGMRNFGSRLDVYLPEKNNGQPIRLRYGKVDK